MKKVIITQRFEKIGKHRELRDNLDVRLYNLIEKLGYNPIPLPNNLKNINKFIYQISPDGIILSGGGDPLKKDKRRKNELKLIKYSLKKKYH
jgi:putative glutamine amidotransferase